MRTHKNSDVAHSVSARERILYHVGNFGTYNVGITAFVACFGHRHFNVSLLGLMIRFLDNIGIQLFEVKARAAFPGRTTPVDPVGEKTEEGVVELHHTQR